LLNANPIWPVCNRPVHCICVGKHLEDQPLGNDIICLDCVEAESNAGLEDDAKGVTATATSGDEGAMVTATVLDVSYKLAIIRIHQPGKHCSYKKERGICVFMTVVTCSSKDCSSNPTLCPYYFDTHETFMDRASSFAQLTNERNGEGEAS
jgi:hypothetical protein